MRVYVIALGWHVTLPLDGRGELVEDERVRSAARMRTAQIQHELTRYVRHGSAHAAAQ